MNVEFYFRTYNSFGSNATLALLSQWCTGRLPGAYGPNIESLVVEGCCKNHSPPRKSLEHIHESFEVWLHELPVVEIQERGTELRICFRAVRYSHDEVKRDMNVLALFTFRSFLSKTIQLLEDELTLRAVASQLDLGRIARDLKSALEDAPQTLDELVQLYVQRQNAA